MRRILKGKPVTDQELAGHFAAKTQVAVESSVTVQAVSIDELQMRTLEILRREISNLMVASARGSLSRDDAMSLTGYIKLLKELKDNEKELLANASDEELEKIANAQS